MEVLIALLIFVVIAVVLLWLTDQFPLGDPTKKIIKIVIVAILLIAFLLRFSGYLGLGAVK